MGIGIVFIADEQDAAVLLKEWPHSVQVGWIDSGEGVRLIWE